MRPKAARAASFAAAAGSVGVAALLTRACPGPCTTCSSCATTLVPMGSALGAAGLAFVSSAIFRARSGSGDAPSDR